MAYVDYTYYKSLYGTQAVEEADFNRLAWEACRELDDETSGVDGVRKLKVSFPTDEEDVEMVKRCACKLIEIKSEIEKAKNRVSAMQGYIERTDGTVVNKLVSSVSAGNESISYATSNNSGNNATLIDKALTDRSVEKKLYSDTIREYLHGVADANGVNLLYMGRYPYKYTV